MDKCTLVSIDNLKILGYSPYNFFSLLKCTYRNSFNVSATMFFYFSLFGNFQSDVLAIFSETSCTTDMLCTSFESPNIELLESEIKLSVASSRGLPHPLRGDYLLRVTIFQGRLSIA